MKCQSLIGALALSLLIYGGGRPSKGTKADKRLKENQPKPTMPPRVQPGYPQPKKAGGK